MNDVSFADVLFIILVFGIIYVCLLLARRANAKQRPPAEGQEK